jgi:hypothetical protein
MPDVTKWQMKRAERFAFEAFGGKGEREFKQFLDLLHYEGAYRVSADAGEVVSIGFAVDEQIIIVIMQVDGEAVINQTVHLYWT